MNKIETYGPSEKVKEMWPKKIEEFAPFVKELFKEGKQSVSRTSTSSPF